MAIKSMDLIAQAKKDNAVALAAAFKTGDEAQMAESLANFCNGVQEAVLQQAAAEAESRNADNAIMAQRGAHVLTSAEMGYYNALAKAASAADPAMAITQIDVAMPQTIIDSVIDDIKKNHPLLARIKFTNTAYMTRMIMNAAAGAPAAWGKITTAVAQELNGKLQEVDLTLCKLSAFFCISQDLLELGPVWIDQYIRAILAESVATAMEEAAVVGDGKDKPIGMNRDVSEEAEVRGGVQPEQTPLPLLSLSVQELGGVVADIARDPLDETQARVVDDLIFICNPFDYWEKIMPATTFQIAGTGQYVHDVLPIPADIYQSAALAKGRAVLGMADHYFAALGTGKDGKVTTDDSIKFLEDERTYKVKMYGNARPKDKYAFRLLDISGLNVEHVAPVKVVGEVTTKAGAPAAAAAEGK